MMVGRPVQLQVDKDAGPARRCGAAACEDLHRALPSAQDATPYTMSALTSRAGEIVCIAGIDGNGQTEFIHGLTGLDKSSRRQHHRCAATTSPTAPSATGAST